MCNRPKQVCLTTMEPPSHDHVRVDLSPVPSAKRTPSVAEGKPNRLKPVPRARVLAQAEMRDDLSGVSPLSMSCQKAQTNNQPTNQLKTTSYPTSHQSSDLTLGFQSPDGAFHRTKSGQQSQAYNGLHSRHSRPFNGASRPP